MRILYIVNGYPDEKNPALEPFVKAQIDSMAAYGHEVSVHNVRGRDSKFNYLRAAAQTRGLVRRQPFDIVHGHYVYSGWVAAMQCVAPSVVSFMGSDLYGTIDSLGDVTLRGRLDMFLSTALQHVVDGIIVKSTEMQGLLRRSEKSLVLPNGVNFERFRDLGRAESRASLGLAPNKKYVLFAGDHTRPRKCYPVVTEAVRLLNERHGGGYEVLLASRVAHSAVALYMSAADVLALPSQREGSPNVVKEAMACNLPVVSTDVGDVREVLRDTAGCRIVERTPEAFAEAIREIVGTVERTAGREAIAHLRSETIAERLTAFYQELVSKRRAK